MDEFESFVMDEFEPCCRCASLNTKLYRAGPLVAIGCRVCAETGPYRDTIDDAIAAWNTRAAPKEQTP